MQCVEYLRLLVNLVVFLSLTTITCNFTTKLELERNVCSMAKSQLSRDTIYMCTVLHSIEYIFSKAACRLVFFHNLRKTLRRHTKTFLLASAAIIRTCAGVYVCVLMMRIGIHVH